MPEYNQRHLNALNIWLNDVYDEETSLESLLSNLEFTQQHIGNIQHGLFHEFFEHFLRLLENYNDLLTYEREFVMLDHYGLIDGNPNKDFYLMGHKYGVW